MYLQLWFYIYIYKINKDIIYIDKKYKRTMRDPPHNTCFQLCFLNNIFDPDRTYAH